MPIKLISSGGGSVILDAPSTGTNFTLTVPAETGNVITTAAGSGINASAMSAGTVPRSRLPSGSILQVVSDTRAITESTTTDGLVTASTNISITPYFATSRILVFFDILVYVSGTGGRGFRTGIARKIGSGTTNQILGSGFNGVSGHNISAYSSGWNENHHRVPWTCVDTPNTTQQVTYYPMYGCYSAGVTANLGNGGNQYATFTLWEIAG